MHIDPLWETYLQRISLYPHSYRILFSFFFFLQTTFINNSWFWDHHNNYYITMGNSTFKRTFQSHLDPDEIQTESKRSLIGCLCHSCFLWRPTFYYRYYNIFVTYLLLVHVWMPFFRQFSVSLCNLSLKVYGGNKSYNFHSIRIFKCEMFKYDLF